MPITTRMSEFVLIFSVLCFGGMQMMNAQRLVGKTNLLYWCTGTINAGLEVRVSRHYTINVEGEINPLAFGEKSLKHYAIQPEIRYWMTGRPQAQWFYGVLGTIGRKEINITGTNKHVDTFGGGISDVFITVFDIVATVLLWITAFLTLVAGVTYLIDNKEYINPNK